MSRLPALRVTGCSISPSRPRSCCSRGLSDSAPTSNRAGHSHLRHSSTSRFQRVIGVPPGTKALRSRPPLVLVQAAPRAAAAGVGQHGFGVAARCLPGRVSGTLGLHRLVVSWHRRPWSRHSCSSDCRSGPGVTSGAWAFHNPRGGQVIRPATAVTAQKTARVAGPPIKSSLTGWQGRSTRSEMRVASATPPASRGTISNTTGDAPAFPCCMDHPRCCPRGCGPLRIQVDHGCFVHGGSEMSSEARRRELSSTERPSGGVGRNRNEH